MSTQDPRYDASQDPSAQDDAGDSESGTDVEQSEGERSEIGVMDPADADTPISDSQSVGGQPDMESGRADEGPQGPNANPHAEQNTH